LRGRAGACARDEVPRMKGVSAVEGKKGAGAKGWGKRETGERPSPCEKNFMNGISNEETFATGDSGERTGLDWGQGGRRLETKGLSVIFLGRSLGKGISIVKIVALRRSGWIGKRKFASG